jgi:hypothetical protein
MWEKITGGKANPVYTAASAKQEKMAKADKMRKATDKAKSSRRASKRAISNDNSLKARKDYERHDDGHGVEEIENDIPQAYLQDLMMDYYRAYVAVNENKAYEIERATRGSRFSR